VSAREEVLRRIRAANRAAGSPSTVDIPRAYRTVGDHSTVELLDLLRDRLVDYRARVVDTDAAGVPAAIADALAGLDGPVVVPAGLPDGWCPAGVVDDGGPAVLLDAAAAVVTACAAACAETGTIALDGGADVHVCVVRAEQVVATVPELVARLDPTRPLTFISGPSATSDIELERVEGVHGPRTLVVILVR